MNLHLSLSLQPLLQFGGQNYNFLFHIVPTQCFIHPSLSSHWAVLSNMVFLLSCIKSDLMEFVLNSVLLSLKSCHECTAFNVHLVLHVLSVLGWFHIDDKEMFIGITTYVCHLRAFNKPSSPNFQLLQGFSNLWQSDRIGDCFVLIKGPGKILTYFYTQLDELQDDLSWAYRLIASKASSKDPSRMSG